MEARYMQVELYGSEDEAFTSARKMKEKAYKIK